jgi:hypothetical protein
MGAASFQFALFGPGDTADARALSSEELLRSYRPAAKNRLVLDRDSVLSFTEIAEGDNGLTRWEFFVHEGREPEDMKVVAQGFGVAAERLFA